METRSSSDTIASARRRRRWIWPRHRWGSLHDWNVVVCIQEGGFKRARSLLRPFGAVRPTEYHNVLVMKVEEVGAFMQSLLREVQEDPTILEAVISRIAPGGACFAFGSPDEFEAKANAEALALLPQLLGKSFHVRVHRRGFKGRLESHEEERYLGHVLLEAMYAVGQPGVLTFEDPDMIVVAETVSNHASLACWSREDLEGYPFLRID